MERNIWSAILVGVGLTIFMAVIPPVVVGGVPDAPREFARDFGSLIAGVLAILAASLTIRQMRETDKIQRQQFYRGLAEARRSNILSIRRSELDLQKIETANKVVRAFTDMGITDDVELRGNFEASKRLNFAVHAVSQVHAAIHGARIGEARRHFPVELEAAFDECTNWSEILTAIVPEGYDYFAWFRERAAVPAWYNDFYAIGLADLLTSSERFAELYGQWHKQELTQWLDQYGLKGTK